MPALLQWLRLNWSLLVLLVGLGLVFIFLKNSPTPGMDSLQALDKTLASDRPVVLEFYSNF